MDIKNGIIITHQGKEYSEYAISLAGSIVRRQQSHTAGVVITLTPIREDENGRTEMMPQDAKDGNGVPYVKKFSTSDIRNCGDQAAVAAFVKILASIEEFKNTKGW